MVHLAIPCHNLEEAVAFYRDRLGCRVGRYKGDRVTFDFFGAQLVCHLAPDAVPPTSPYPLHFGLWVETEESYQALYRQLSARYVESEGVRYPGCEDEHRFCFARDPSGNILELKWYRHDTVTR